MIMMMMMMMMMYIDIFFLAIISANIVISSVRSKFLNIIILSGGCDHVSFQNNIFVIEASGNCSSFPLHHPMTGPCVPGKKIYQVCSLLQNSLKTESGI